MKKAFPHWLIFLIMLLIWEGCKKDPVIIDDNNAPYYDDVPTVLIKNYINRLYIDLLGREPLDAEMSANLDYLRQNELTHGSRDSLVQILQYDTTFVAGDLSYSHAYYKRLYDLCKVRFIEGASNGDIMQKYGNYYHGYKIDSINGDKAGMAEKRIAMDKLTAIIDAEEEYRDQQITINEFCRRMIYNYFYDFINMGTFNMVNASFNDLYFRYPTSYEFQQGFDMIEYNASSSIFGKAGQNKEDYVWIVTHSREFYEGMINWAYKTLLAREPGTDEVYEAMKDFYVTGDFQKVQRDILITDEYANFK